MTVIGRDCHAFRSRARSGCCQHDALADAADASTRRRRFADHGGINDWHADGTRGIWVQGIHRDWFYGTFMTACTGLDTPMRSDS